MVQTRGQQVGDQFPLDVGSGALQGFTAEGDGVATAVCSGSTLKHAVSPPGSGYSANTPRSTCADKESFPSCEGAESPTHVSVSVRENEHERVNNVNVPQDVNVHPLCATPHDGNDTGATDSLRETGSCPPLRGL